jgi:outer membrane protein assembly factor BamA
LRVGEGNNSGVTGKKKLERARQRIRGLGFWQVPRGSNLTTVTTGFQDHQVYREAYVTLRDTPRERVKDIVVDLDEADTGSLRFAAGVGSNAGLIGDITYSKTNFDPLDWPDDFGDILNAFSGGGQFLVLSWQPGTQFSRWRAAWGNPRIFDSLWSVVGEVYSVDWRREDWREDRLGYSIRVGRRLSDDLSGSVTLRDEVVEVNRIDDDAPQLVFDFEGENRVTSATFEFRLERLNNYLEPSEGYRTEVTLEHAGLWGDVEFNKAMIKGEYYTTLDEDDIGRLHILRTQATIGWASEFGDTRDIPVFERFFAGGQGSLRGFRYRGVGPRDNDSPIGGKALWLFSSEYQFPVWEENIRGVAFFDSGSVAREWSDSSIWDVRASVGFGLRILIPFLGEGPLAIDFGIPLLEQDGDDTQIISFSFGNR